MQAIREGLAEIVASDPPMTVRQVFYQAVTQGLVGKTEAEYQGTVARLLLELRRSGDVPYSSIADNTRWMRKPRTYSNLRQWWEQSKRFYRAALWDRQDDYV